MKYIIRNRTYNDQYKKTMESTTKDQLCLYAAIKRNGKRQREMAMIPGKIGVIRKVPVVDMRHMRSRIPRGVAFVIDIVNNKTKH